MGLLGFNYPTLKILAKSKFNQGNTQFWRVQKKYYFISLFDVFIFVNASEIILVAPQARSISTLIHATLILKK